jgi:hypothetical protein
MVVKETLLMKNMVLPAVNELNTLRQALTELRLREEELCDEIRAHATELCIKRIEGDDRTAVIETRSTRQLDATLLPFDILNDPKMYSEVHKTHILLWPRLKTAQMSAAPPIVQNHAPETSLDRTTVSPPSDAVFDMPAAGSTVPTLDLPTLDAHKIAETVEEMAAPADLRATDHPQLHPLGGLYTDDLEVAFYGDDDEVPQVVDPQAVEDAAELQSDFDIHVAQADQAEDVDDDMSSGTPFMTRRIIGMPV